MNPKDTKPRSHRRVSPLCVIVPWWLKAPDRFTKGRGAWFARTGSLMHWVALWLAAMLCPCAAFAQVKDEGEAKASVVLNLVKYTTWPESAFSAPADPLVIGILGRPSFGKKLDAYNRRKVRGRPLL